MGIAIPSRGKQGVSADGNAIMHKIKPNLSFRRSTSYYENLPRYTITYSQYHCDPRPELAKGLPKGCRVETRHVTSLAWFKHTHVRIMSKGFSVRRIVLCFPVKIRMRSSLPHCEHCPRMTPRKLPSWEPVWCSITSEKRIPLEAWHSDWWKKWKSSGYFSAAIADSTNAFKSENTVWLSIQYTLLA